MQADANKIRPCPTDQGFRIGYFFKRIAATSYAGSERRLSNRDRDIYAFFNGDRWVFQGCQLVFGSEDECQLFIERHADELFASIESLLSQYD